MKTAAADQDSLAGWWKATGWFGLAWFALFAVGAIVLQGEPPAYDQPLSEARDFFTSDSDRYLLGDYLAGLAFFFGFLPFVVGLSRLLGLAEGEPKIASGLVLAGGIATIAIGDAATAFLDSAALSGGPGSDINDSTLRGLLRGNSAAIAAIGLPMALTALASAAAIWRTGVLPRWVAAIAALAGGLHLVGASFLLGGPDGPLFFVRFAALIVFAAFVVGTSVSLIRRGAEQ